MEKNLNILMVAYYFPPDSSSGSFRPLHFANHLAKMGQKIWILTAREADFLDGQPRDAKLLSQVDEAITILRTPVSRPREAVVNLKRFLPGGRSEASAGGDGDKTPKQTKDTRLVRSERNFFQRFKDAITDLLGSPDPNVGWLPWAVKAGRKAIRQNKIDVIYATGSPWTCFLVGAVLKKMTGAPLVLDFRDPWVSNPGFWVRSVLPRSIELVMERKIVALSDRVVSNTEALRQDFAARFPTMADKFKTIPNGFETYAEAVPPSAEKIEFTHAGELYFSRNPKNLLKAVLNVVQKGAVPTEALRITFLGGISIPDPELDALLAHPALAGVIKTVPRLPYQEAMAYQINSEVLFLIQPDFPLQVPRKLYEYISFSKPVLAITNREGATAGLVRENELGIVASEVDELESAIQWFYEKWKSGELAQYQRRCDQFLNENLTRDLLTCFRESVG